MQDWVLILGLIAGYFLLMRVVVPKLGVST